MSLIILGTVALDNIKTNSGMKKELMGGSAAHFAMSARLFTKVHLVSVVGEDFPSRHIQLLRRKGIDLASVMESPGKTFQWKGEYRKGDYNHAITLSTELGVLANYVPQITYDQRNIPNVFLANIDPDNQMKFLKLMRDPKFIGLDSMNLWISNMRRSVLKLVKKERSALLRPWNWLPFMNCSTICLSDPSLRIVSSCVVSFENLFFFGGRGFRTKPPPMALMGE